MEEILDMFSCFMHTYMYICMFSNNHFISTFFVN